MPGTNNTDGRYDDNTNLPSGARVAIVFEWFQHFGAAERFISQPVSQYMIHRTVSGMLEEAPASAAMTAGTAAPDGSSIHRSKVVQQFPRSGANARLQLEQVPSYASELHLDEESGSARSMWS